MACSRSAMHPYTAPMLALLLLLHLAPVNGEIESKVFTSPFPDISDVDNTIASHVSTRGVLECITWCVSVPQCVAVSVTAAAVSDGSRTCQLKDHLVTLQKWLTPAPGHAYFHVVPPAYNRTGCFRHDTRENFHFISITYRIAYNDWQEDIFAQMIPGCAAMAWRRGYGVFGIEYAGECWATQTSVDYRADGLDVDDTWDGCMHNVGIQSRSISVFEFSAEPSNGQNTFTIG